jgi:UMF1 family MFS transporter
MSVMNTARKPSTLSVASWVTYDLANTIFSLNIVSLYFSLWVVNIMGGTDAQYGYVTSISMAVIFVCAPFLGALTDLAPRRMPFLVGSTLICIAFTMLLGHGGLALSLAAFAVANIAYQAGLQFYDALLPDVSTEKNRGWIGGISVSVGYMGSFIGIITGTWMLKGADILPHAEQMQRYARLFQVTGALFLLFSLPCFFFVRERKKPERHFSLASLPKAFSQVAATVRSGKRYPGLLRFLVGRAFYTDAINTVITFMGIYVTNEVGYTSAQASQVLATAIVFAIIAGFIWGRAADRIGPKRTLNIVIYVWMADMAWAAAVGYFRLPGAMFWPVPVLAGIAMGGTWAADRPLMLRLTPPNRVGEFYGLYGMVGRFSAVTGPFLWAFVSNTLGLGRPAALLSLLAMLVLSYVILIPVSDEPRHWKGADLVGAGK